MILRPIQAKKGEWNQLSGTFIGSIWWLFFEHQTCYFGNILRGHACFVFCLFCGTQFTESFRFYTLQLVPQTSQKVGCLWISNLHSLLWIKKIEAQINHPNFNQARCLLTLVVTASESHCGHCKGNVHVTIQLGKHKKGKSWQSPSAYVS